MIIFTKKTRESIFLTGGLLCLIGAVLMVFDVAYGSFPFVLGAVVLIVSHVLQALDVKENDFRQRRTSRLGFIFSLLLLAAIYFVCIDSNYWVVCVLIYSSTLLFLSFREN